MQNTTKRQHLVHWGKSPGDEHRKDRQYRSMQLRSPVMTMTLFIHFLPAGLSCHDQHHCSSQQKRRHQNVDLTYENNLQSLDKEFTD